jgi:hypothetical protein
MTRLFKTNFHKEYFEELVTVYILLTRTLIRHKVKCPYL